MKRILYFLIFCGSMLGTTAVMGQSGKLKKANQLFDRFDYPAAAEIYKKIIAKSEEPEAVVKLAECYWKMNKPDEAEYWFEKAIVLPQSEDVHKLYYGMTLKMNGKCDKARKVLMDYAQLVPADSRGLRLVESCDKQDFLQQDPGLFEIKTLDINTTKSDFGPAFYNDGLVYSSASRGKYADKTYDWTGEPFLDLFYAKSQSKDDPSQLGKSEEFQGKANTEMHEGTVSFSKDNKTMYFTRNNYINGKKGKDRENTIRLKIFQMSSIGDLWTDEKNLPFNNDNYSVGHPSLSEDGNFLYFASDMPGGYGETDIYVSRRTGNSWSAPENLGPEINTEGKEMFPFIHNDGTLYFASDALPGLGGLDIFSSTKAEGTWTAPENLRAPINTISDDFGFIINKEKELGYFASNRAGGQGMDDIYAFSRAQFLLNGVVVNAQTLEPIDGATVKLLYKDKVAQEVVTKADGSFSFPIGRNMEYIVEANKEHFEPGKQPANTSGIEGSSMDLKIPINKIADQIKCELRGLVYDKDSGVPVEAAMVKLINSATKAEKIFNTTNDGRYQFDLEPETDYVIFATKEYYFTTTKSVSTRGRDCSSPLMKDLALDIALTKIVVDVANPKVIGKDVLDIKHIYYDLNKSNIRPDAAVELDKVVKLMYDNPGLVIELGSHTDSRSSDEYNLNLSQKRADAAVSYISSRGITKDRIKARGYGESALINRCTNGVACSEEEHQLNRRTEFKVIGYQTGAPMYSEPRYYGTGYAENTTVKSTFVDKGGESPTVFDKGELDQHKSTSTSNTINSQASNLEIGDEYKIQLGALRSVSLKKFDKLKDLGQIETEQAGGGITKVLLSSYNDRTAAENTLNTVRNRGFRDAFIVAYKEGKRIP